jgi:Flp pilus assembly protein TadD
MPSFRASVGFLAVSALLSGTALAATPEPQPAVATMNQSLETGLRDAQMKRQQRDFTGAIRTLSQLMLVAADDPRVIGEYGKVLVQQGRSHDALDFLNRAVQLNQADWTLFSAMGVAYDQTGDFENARLAYEHAMALKPGETAVLNNYAMSRALAGDLVEAKRLIGEASAGPKDVRVARNAKMINSLTPKLAATTPPVIKHSPVASAPKAVATNTPAVLTKPLPAPAASKPAAARTLTAAEGRNIMMQAVPVDPKAGPVGKARKAATATASAAPVKKTNANVIPALRLANDRQ